MSDYALLDFIEKAQAAALEVARARAEVGMERAADKAEKCERGWREQALDAVRRYAVLHAGPFLAEHIAIAVPPEADRRAIGSVMQEAGRRGWLKSEGWAPACSSNGSAKRRWKSLICEGSA